MSTKTKTLLAAAGAAAVAGLLLFYWTLDGPGFQPDPAFQASLRRVVDDYRRIIVLVDGSDALEESARARAIAAGRIVFYRKQAALADVGRTLQEEYRQAEAARLRAPARLRQFLNYLSTNRDLHEADKLAFLSIAEDLEAAIPPDAGRSNPLAAPVRALHDNLQSIQLAYREEVTRIFSQFATRGPAGTREKWDTYVARLRQLTSRDKILAEFTDALPEEPVETSRGGASNEIFGNEFAPKTVALTFDDGPHPRYTEQILALLLKYGIRGCFFELGSNLGEVKEGQVKLARTAAVSRKVLDAGHVIANHSYSHPVLPKLSGEARAGEIDRTDLLLRTISGRAPELFRAPYGARNKDVLDKVAAEGLRSVMWTIDSLDWADPVPESIAMRVLHELNQKQKGIILFHDIHKQSVMALPPVIEELRRLDYSFLAFENGKFVKSEAPVETGRAATAESAGPPSMEPRRSLYRDSWAVVIGINDYRHWPKLRYAVNDAQAIEEALVAKFGFKRENIRKLTNQQATRQRIMEVLGDEFTDGRKVGREDRVFFFFAGHGATRTLEDGRQIGFIVPVDADRANYYSTAISMTALREASDLVPAKHIYFVMDSCYSGLALSRGGGAFQQNRTYLEEVTRRSARQILTAGGADQQVSDDGPDGHSVFTWALLQGLQGQADLDHNGFITASELGAYISPIVSQFAKQTPTVGNLVGSEGGEFIFELQPEPLSAATEQLKGQGLQLNEKLSALEKQIAAKQAELLRLQQSIQAEAAKLAQVKGAAPEVIARSAPAPETPVSLKGAQSRSKASLAYTLDRQGLQLYRLKNYDAAEQKFKAAVELKPDDPILLNNLGYVYYVMGRYNESLTYLEKTLSADPKRKEAHGNIAELYLKLGRNQDAKEHYQEYLALYPTSPKAEEFRRILQKLQ